MSATMEALLYVYVLIVYARLISGVTIVNIGTNLVWSDDHGLDMRGHCSFTFSVGFCGAFKLELYPIKGLSLPKYEIFIDRDSSEKYETGIQKYCDRQLVLCTNNGTGTSGHESTPFVTCTPSTWTPFWISWHDGEITLGNGSTVGTFVLIQVNDPEFTHVDYLKMGADDTSTSANFRFEPRTGRPDNPDMTCRKNVTISDVGTDLVWSDDHGLDMRGHCSFTFSVGYCGAFRLELYPEKNLSLPKYEIFIDRDSSEKYETGIQKYCDQQLVLCTNNGTGTSGHESTPFVTCTPSTWAPFWISWHDGEITLGNGSTVGTFVLIQVNDPEFTHVDYLKMGADDTSTSANFRFEPRTGRPDNPDMTCLKNELRSGRPRNPGGKGGPVDVRMTSDNCDNARRPESENLEMVFEKAADDTTLSLSNPDVEGLGSATSGSCAELCASRQTCVLYSISNTGICRITSACWPQVESETGSTVLFLKYWG